MSRTIFTIFGLALLVAAMVAPAGCDGGRQSETPQQSETARKAANYNAFRDPAVRQALESDQAARDEFADKLDKNALGGKAPSGAAITPPATTGGETPAATEGAAQPAAGEDKAAEGSPAE